MKLTFASKADAQARADKIHVALIADSPLYAESVALYIFSAGKAGTARWAIPYQDTDKDGKPVGTNWHIGVDERCRNVLVKDEIAQVLEWKEQPLSSL